MRTQKGGGLPGIDGQTPGLNRATRFTKPLTGPLSADQFRRLTELRQFRVVQDGITFRSVMYHLTNKDSLIMEYINGESTKTMLALSGRWLATRGARGQGLQAARLAGLWLGHFHQWPSDGPQEPYDVSGRCARALDKLHLIRAHGLPEADAEAVRRMLERAASEGAHNQVVTIHGDFKPSNVMQTSDEVVGIDMEGYHQGHRLIDLGQFLSDVFLVRSNMVWGTGAVGWWHQLAVAFLSGYRSTGVVDLRGLEFRLLEAAIGLFAELKERHPGLFWRIRGRQLMVQTLRRLMQAVADKELH